MKKPYLLFSLAMLSLTTLWSQNRYESPVPTMDINFSNQVESPVRITPRQHKTYQNHEERSMVYRYSAGLTDYDQGLTTNPVVSQAIWMWPDTAISVVSKNALGTADTLWDYLDFGQRAFNGASNYCHQVGMVFDARHVIYSQSANGDYVQLSKYNPYTIDSIRFQYYYIRNSDPGIVDTLYLYYIPNSAMKSKGGIGNTGAQPNYPSVALPEFSPATQSPVGYTAMEAIPLTASDTNTTGEEFKTLIVNKIINQSSSAGQVSGVIARFVPGTNYSQTAPFDTLGGDSFDINPITNRHNNFYCVFNYDQTRTFIDNTGVKPSDAIYENGVFLPPFIRYQIGVTPPSIWADRYFPGTVIYSRNGGSERVPVFPEFEYHLTSKNVAIDQLKSQGFLLGNPYPNPSTGDVIRIPFELDRSTQVKISVMNVEGRIVKTIDSKQLGSGVQGIDVQIDDLPNGMYLFNFQAGQHQQTSRFSIVR